MKIEALSDPNFLLRDLESLTNNHFFDGGYVFRGQRDESWELDTSFDRFYTGTLKNRNNKFSELVSQFRKRTKDRLDERLSDGDIISIAQHYGLPTRVLDWSFSPYVALFFAISGALVLNPTKPAALWLLNYELVKSEIDEAELVFLHYEEQRDLRIKNQRGIFSKLLVDEINLIHFLDSRTLGDALTKVVIPPNCFQPFARHLKSMDITHARLFPGLEGHAKELIYEHLV